MGCCNERLLREKDVGSYFCLHCAEERRLRSALPYLGAQCDILVQVLQGNDTRSPAKPL
jgi:hypothetical protein